MVKNVSKPALLALAAMSLYSCAKEGISEPKAEYPVTVTAQPLTTRTQFGTRDGNVYPVLWQAGVDAAFSLDGAAPVAAAPNPSEDFRTATFQPVFTTAPLPAGGKVYGMSPKGDNASTPVSGGFTGMVSAESYASLVLPAEQTPLANSVDPGTQAIFASADYGTEGLPDNLSMKFKHALAYGKLTLTNYAGGSDIASLSIKFPTPVAGNSCKYYYAGNGSFEAGKVYNATDNTITINAQNVDGNVFWFSVVPTGLLDSGEITFVVKNSGGEAYVKTVSLSESKYLAFSRGKISEFSVDFSGIEASGDVWELVTDASTLAEGDQLVLASNAKGMTASALSNSVLTNVESSFSTDYSEITSLGTGSLIFTLGGSEGAWTLSTDSGLLGATAVKKLAFGSGTTSWTISIDANGEATVQNSTLANGRFLYNVNSPRFTTYTSATSISMLLPQLYRKQGGSTPPPAAGMSVTTGDASAISQSEATLSASYSGASELPYTLSFQYGTSQANLDKTAYWNDIIPGLSGSFSVTLESLTAGTTYYYRAVVQVGENDYFGEILSFTTGDEQATGPWLELPEIAAGTNQLSQTLWAGSDRNYTYLYDKDMFCPLWSAYPLYSSTMNGSAPRPGWSYNPNIPEAYQIQVDSKSYPSNYGAADYSRGHHVPNADRNNNSTMQDQTFYLSNQSPQLQNRFNASIWSSLEGGIRSVASSTDTVYVVTGASFRKQGGSETINYLHSTTVIPADLPIPNYFWKVLLKVKRSGGAVTSASAIGVWLEHKEYDASNWQNYVVSVNQIEEYTGFNFFANLSSALQATAEANADWDGFSAF